MSFKFYIFFKCFITVLAIRKKIIMIVITIIIFAAIGGSIFHKRCNVSIKFSNISLDLFIIRVIIEGVESVLLGADDVILSSVEI